MLKKHGVSLRGALKTPEPLALDGLLRTFALLQLSKWTLAHKAPCLPAPRWSPSTPTRKGTPPKEEASPEWLPCTLEASSFHSKIDQRNCGTTAELGLIKPEGKHQREMDIFLERDGQFPYLPRNQALTG